MTYSRRLLLTVLLIDLFVLLIAVTAVVHGYRQAREHAEIVTQNLAHVLESDLANTLRRVDVALLALLELHADHRREHVRDPALMAAHIEALRRHLPEVDAIRLTDVHGMLAYGSDVAPAERIDLSDRPHFLHLRENPEIAIAISAPQRSRVNDKQVIVLARRITDAHGAFDGMIFAAIELESLTRRFARIDLGPGGVVSLRDANLGLVARHPEPYTAGFAIDQTSAPPEMTALFAAGESAGTFHAGPGAKTRERTVTFRKLDDFPLYITVGLSADDYLEDWRREVFWISNLTLLFLLGSIYAASMQRRIWLRQQSDHAALRRQERLYHELVEDAPTMIVRYRPDTTIIYANGTYADFFGSTPEALAGRRWLDFVAEDEDKTNAALRIANLTLDQPVAHAFQYRMIGKDGQTHWTQWNDRAFFDEDGELMHLQSIGMDITESKRSQDVQAARLRLMEFATDHSMRELLIATLDEAGALTESPIGFYHYLAEDQKTLSLQAWSTRTLAEFCHAEGDGLHYNIDDAGVWVEAVRERRPVIHNDYAALPNKRGLPPGHAEVLREMVVPVFRKGLIVAILGVGNKPRPYTDYDLRTVALLADLAWDFAESKRLEAELVAMATTDALTGLANRRSFLARMENELARLKRVDIAHAAVLMLDLDHFKKVNDTHGHAVGDAILAHFSGLVREELRKIDTGGRLGGEEFAILLIGAEVDAAARFAERLRHKVETTPLIQQAKTVPVTVSIGIAALTANDDSADDALSRADKALYAAKNGGRNRVCLAPASPD